MSPSLARICCWVYAVTAAFGVGVWLATGIWAGLVLGLLAGFTSWSYAELERLLR